MKIAIIGGIGSGKSEVLKVARELGLATLSADEINAELLEKPDYISQIAQVFPSAVKRGKIIIPKLAQIVFSDKEQLARLNSIAHPKILERITTDVRDPLVVEMPLLVECGAQGLFDEIVLVYTPLNIRKERLATGRGMFRAQVESRIGAQASEEVLQAVATRVIDNSLDLEVLKENARKLFWELARIC